MRRASFENLYAAQIFDTRLKISNLKLSANGNAGGTLMLRECWDAKCQHLVMLKFLAFGNADKKLSINLLAYLIGWRFWTLMLSYVRSTQK